LACQPNATWIQPPTSIASGGTSPMVMPTKAIMRVRSRPVNRSCTSARPVTMPAAAPAPCSTRAMVSTARLGANAAITDAMQAITSPTTRIGLRPMRSDSAPYTSCMPP
jgi:hypothetical protein